MQISGQIRRSKPCSDLVSFASRDAKYVTYLATLNFANDRSVDEQALDITTLHKVIGGKEPHEDPHLP